MRLLNTTTLEFKEFFESNTPAYSILSHRWENEEVSFEAFREDATTRSEEHGIISRFYKSSTSDDKRSRLKGYGKISRFCKLSAELNHNWAWIDTCCIDKRSSAELSEAINSMYTWYSAAEVCLVYLSDVTGLSDFAASKWFTRGWTLQELLAPANVVFYNQDWVKMGDRDEMAPQIASITRINLRALLSTPDSPYGRAFEIMNASVATKMSWMGYRRTSRGEDIAYCLLGLFQVNMPLLYGEGKQAAFARLQREILVRSDDESIFAWTNSAPLYGSSILAHLPTSFDGSVGIRRLNQHDHGCRTLANRKPYRITNKGLQMDVHLLKLSSDPKEFCIPINCTKAGKHESRLPLVVEIRHSDGTNTLDRTYQEYYYRIRKPITVTSSVWEGMVADPITGLKRRLEDIPTKKIFLFAG